MKTVKFFAVSFIITLCAVITSCGDDDDTTNVGNEGGNGSITGTVAKVDVKKAGSLSTLISDDVKFNITDLTISGDINGDDIALIREMAGADFFGNKTSGQLAKLNLVDANLIGGIGEYYYEVMGLISDNDAIWSCMFYKCISLTNILLPNNVKYISPFAFSGCTNLQAITMNDKITAIGNNAFSYTGLLSFIIPDNVQTLGSEVFANCTKLESITLGNSVYTMGDNIFKGCLNLKQIVISDDNATYTADDGIIFNKSKSELIKCYYLNSSSYTVPNTVKKIGDNAFLGCTQLEMVTVSNNVIMIGNSAFDGCNELLTVRIGAKVSSINGTAFEGCVKLKEFVE